MRKRKRAPSLRAKVRSALKRRPKKQVPWSAIRKHNRKREPSSLELAVYAMLEAEGIPFQREKTIGRMHVDVFLEPNLVVELQGCFWHGCLVCNPEPTPTQRAKNLKDARRAYILRKKGFDVVTIWEHEVKSHPDRVQAMLKGIWTGLQT